MKHGKIDGWLAFASLMGLLAVALGAFGSHGLKGILDEYHMSVFQTANRYHFFHVLALLFTCILPQNSRPGYLQFAKIFFSLGLLIFAGSLYILALTGISWLGALTPVGGVFFLLGWLFLMLSAFPRRG